MESDTLTADSSHTTVRGAVDDLTQRLARVSRQADIRDLYRRSVLATAGVLIGLFLGVLIEAVGYLSPVYRTVFVYLFVLGIVPGAIGYCIPPMLRLAGILTSESTEDLARRVGLQFPSIRDRLLNIIQLGQQRAHHAWVSSELIEDSVRTLHAELDGVDLREANERRTLSTAIRRSALVVVGVAIIVLLWPSTFMASLHRLTAYDQEFAPPRAYAFAITPGNIEVAKGSDVSLSIAVRSPGETDELPENVQLFLKGEGQAQFERNDLHALSAGTFVHQLPNIRYSYEYYVSAEDENSDMYRITVLDWPSFQSFRVRLDQPAYAHLPATLQEDFAGEISALPGTRVTLTGRASKELSSGSVVLSDSSIISLALDGMAFTAAFTVERTGSYTVHITDLKGLRNRSPIPYAIRIVPDAFPAVSITEPGRNVDIAGNESIGLFVEASDDFGVSSLTLNYRLSHSRFVRPSDEYTTVTIPLPDHDRRDVVTSFLWDLGPLDLVPEDVIEYVVEVADNDTVHGPKMSRSQAYTLRLPSLEEVFSDVETGHEKAVQELDESITEAEELRKDVEQINRDLKTNKQFDWQDQKKVEEMAKKAEDIRKRLAKTEKRLKDLTDEMQRQEVLSTETLEKYLELQNLFQQMNSDELQQALQSMQQAMQGVRRDQLQQAMQKVEFTEERFRQGIERTLNLLKRIQIEQRMDEAVERATDLTERQKGLIDDHDRSTKEHAGEQERLAEDERRLEELMQDLQTKMEEFFTEMPAEKLGELNTQVQQQRLQERMAQAARQMRSGQMQEAQQAQKQIQQSLESLTQQMQSLQQQMLQNQTDRVLNSLRRATNDLLELSQRQEQVKNAARSSPNNSPSLRDNAQQQMSIMRDLNSIAASLSELAQKSFAVTPEMGRSIGEAMRGMQNAMRDLDVRNGQQASQDQTTAMASLNKTAQQVQQSLETLMQGAQGSPGGMGLMQQLQMMAGRQMQLNVQTQRMGETPGDGDAMRRASEAARIARGQEAVRKSLEQLQREARASGEQDRILGDLDRIANDMREVIRNLEQNNVDDQTIRQQERILSRLLDASRSMRERDFEKRREATAGRKFTRRGPQGLPTDETKNWLREEMLRALERGYSRDYQELIRRYFEELERHETDGE